MCCSRLFSENSGTFLILYFIQNVVLYFVEYRYLEDDFILVQAKISVPCAYLSRKVSYKYIVTKGKEKDAKGTVKHLWEQLPGGGPYKNRCLQIPKERCQTGGTSFSMF